MSDDDRKKKTIAPRANVRDVGQTSPVAILTLALAGGIGYCSWRLWTKWKAHRDAKDRTAGSRSQEASASTKKSSSKGSPFSFDQQPKAAASTSGRSTAAPSSNSNNSSRSRQAQKPKSQKQLRKEAKQAKKEAKEQAARDAENMQLASAIAKRAKEVGLGVQPPEPEKQYYVDYEGVTKAYEKIVEWQQTGKKKY